MVRKLVDESLQLLFRFLGVRRIPLRLQHHAHMDIGYLELRLGCEFRGGIKELEIPVLRLRLQKRFGAALFVIGIPTSK